MPRARANILGPNPPRRARRRRSGPGRRQSGHRGAMHPRHRGRSPRHSRTARSAICAHRWPRNRRVHPRGDRLQGRRATARAHRPNAPSMQPGTPYATSATAGSGSKAPVFTLPACAHDHRLCGPASTSRRWSTRIRPLCIPSTATSERVYHPEVAQQPEVTWCRATRPRGCAARRADRRPRRRDPSSRNGRGGRPPGR